MVLNNDILKDRRDECVNKFKNELYNPKIMSPSEKLEDIIVHCQDTTYDKNNKV